MGGREHTAHDAQKELLRPRGWMHRDLDMGTLDFGCLEFASTGLMMHEHGVLEGLWWKSVL